VFHPFDNPETPAGATRPPMPPGERFTTHWKD